jgi:hypothetical protein
MTLFFISPGMIITSFYWELVEQIVHRLLCPLPCYQAIACTLVSLLQQLMLQPQTVVSLFSTTPGMIILHSTWSCLCTEVTWPSFVRASPSEFVIPLAKYVKAVYHTRVSVGMRFRMLFETEESSVRRWVETCTVHTAWKLWMPYGCLFFQIHGYDHMHKWSGLRALAKFTLAFCEGEFFRTVVWLQSTKQLSIPSLVKY